MARNIRGIDKLDLSEAAIDINNYILGRPYNFKSLEKVKKYLEKDTMNIEEEMFFFKSFREGTSKEYHHVEDIQLEKKLMLYEIRDIKSIPKERADEIWAVLINMSNYLITQEAFYGNRRFATAIPSSA